MEQVQQGTVIRITFSAFLKSDHVSPATGKTIAVQFSKNGGAYGNPAAGATNATEIGNGDYYVDAQAGDTNTPGPLLVLGTEGTIDPARPEGGGVRVVAAATVNANVIQVAGQTASASTPVSFSQYVGFAQPIPLDQIGATYYLAVSARGWLGKAIQAPNISGVPAVDVVDVNGQPATLVIGAVVGFGVGVAAVPATPPGVGNLVIQASDDYYAADNRAITYTDTGGVLPNLTTYTAQLFVRTLAPKTLVATVTNPGATQQVLSVDWPRNTLPAGSVSVMAEWQIIASNGHVQTVATFSLTVV